MVTKIGLDTDTLVIWFRNYKSGDKHTPSYARKGYKLYTNYKVYAELINLLKTKEYTDYSINELKKQVAKFLNKNNLNKIRKNNIDLRKVDKISQELKKIKFSSNPGKEDIEIISIYYIAEMDGIVSRNVKHFKQPCKYLGLLFEKSTQVENFSEDDARRMFSNFMKSYKRL